MIYSDSDYDTISELTESEGSAPSDDEQNGPWVADDMDESHHHHHHHEGRHRHRGRVIHSEVWVNHN